MVRKGHHDFSLETLHWVEESGSSRALRSCRTPRTEDGFPISVWCAREKSPFSMTIRAKSGSIVFYAFDLLYLGRPFPSAAGRAPSAAATARRRPRRRNSVFLRKLRPTAKKEFLRAAYAHGFEGNITGEALAQAERPVAEDHP